MGGTLYQYHDSRKCAYLRTGRRISNVDMVLYGSNPTMLVPDEQTEAFAPKDYSWSAKNIMPWTTYSKVQNVPEAVVLVDTNTRKIKTKLEEDWPGAWEKIKFYGQWTMMIKHR